MVKMIAQSASRALGLLIAKDKALGGMSYQCFLKCCDAIVQSTLNYGAPIYGTSTFSCIDAVQNRACRYFLLDLSSMHPTLQLMVIWVGLCLSKNSGFVLLVTGAN